MGYLIHIVLALLVSALAEEGFAARAELPFVVVALVAVPYALAVLARRESLRGNFRRAGWSLTALHGCAPVLHAVAVLGCGWYGTVERLTGSVPRLFAWPEPTSLLALLPFAVYALLAIDAQARATHRSGRGVARTWRFQGRMLLSASAPLLVYVLIAWGVGRSERMRASIDQVQAWAAVFAALLIVLFLTLLPFLLQRTWDTVPLPAGPLRSLLESLGRKARFRCREVLVWRTQNQMANAAVVGVTPQLRVVLLSDALLAQLSLDETLAVFAHEVGHARRHHVMIFVAWSAGFFMAVDLAATAWLPAAALPAGGVLLVSLVVWYLGFGWLSRRFELDADVYSAELLGNVAPMMRALEAVGGGHGDAKRTWRHFAPGHRVAFLQRLAFEPELGTALRRRLRRLSWLGVVLALATLAGEVRGIARAYPADRVRAELALGEYASALERVQRLAAPSEALVRQTVLAASLAGPDGSVAPDALVASARASLASGAVRDALDLLELAAMRGDLDAGEVLDRLESLGEAGGDVAAWTRAADALERDDPAWADALRRGALARGGPDPR